MSKITYSITYNEITPESAEYGDFSDTGFSEEDSKCDFRELVDMLENIFCCSNSSPVSACSLEFVWFSTEYSIECYASLTERQESLHIAKDAVSQRAYRRALKYLKII